MISTAWKQGFKKIWLTTYFDNKSAFEIYQKLGFIVEGIFINEEKLNGKYRHVISMGLFKIKKILVKHIKKLLIQLIN